MVRKYILILLLCWAVPVWAEEAPPLEGIPRHLDFDRRDAVMSRIELTPFGGDYVGDTLQHSFIVGGQFDFRITPMWSVGTDFGWSRISVDQNSNFGSTVTNKNLTLMDGKVVLNLPGAYLSRNKVVEVDFFTDMGAGIMRINNGNRATGFVGGGMKIYSKKSWVGFRVHVRNYFMTLPSTDGDDFTFDVTFLLGPTFQLPPYF
jgi:hypothetical protein